MYIELFLLDNAIYNALMIRLAAAICSRRIRAWRIALFSILGAVYAAFAIHSPLLMSLPFKLISGLVMALCFPLAGLKSYAFSALSLFLSAFIMGGLAITLTLALGGEFSAGFMIASTPVRIAFITAAIACFLPNAMRGMLKRKARGIVKLKLMHDGKTYELSGMIDSGNGLCDPISSLPVIVAHMKGFSCAANIPIPAATVNGSVTLMAFLPQRLIYDGQELHALIALSPNP